MIFFGYRNPRPRKFSPVSPPLTPPLSPSPPSTPPIVPSTDSLQLAEDILDDLCPQDIKVARAQLTQQIAKKVMEKSDNFEDVTCKIVRYWKGE